MAEVLYMAPAQNNSTNPRKLSAIEENLILTSELSLLVAHRSLGVLLAASFSVQEFGGHMSTFAHL